jgi:hypothetical protein
MTTAAQEAIGAMAMAIRLAVMFLTEWIKSRPVSPRVSLDTTGPMAIRAGGPRSPPH